MTVNIAIIGMGQVGTSIGLALADQKKLVRRVGHDRELRHARQAEKMGALDEVNINLPATVEKADLIVLALPMDQIRDTLAIIGPEMRKDALVVDTTPLKQTMLAWAQELLPEGRHYVGLVPVISPLHLETPGSGTGAARADLFRRGLFAVVTSRGAPPEAMRLATDFVDLIGAEHLFIDYEEVDGVVASIDLLPRLLAASLLNATVDQPGWLEARKFTARPFASVTAPTSFGDTPASLALLALNSPQNTLRVLDKFAATLRDLRQLVERQDQAALEQYFDKARSGRERWLKERSGGSWQTEEQGPVEMPTAGEVMGRLFGLGGRPRDKTKK